MGDSLSTQTFAEAARHKAVIVEDELELVIRADKIMSATSCVGVCLASILGQRRSYGHDLIETVREDLYQWSLQAAHKVLEQRPDIFPASIASDFTPQRAWPMAVESAFYMMQNYNGGMIPDTDIGILDYREDFPDEYRPHRMAFAHLVEINMSGFLDEGALMIKEHLGYKYDIDPLWLPLVMQVAQKNNVDLQTMPLTTWFTPCLSEALHDIYPQTQVQRSRHLI